MIRIGVVGAGNIIGKHVKHLVDIPEADIVAITDATNGTVAAALEKHFAGKDVTGYTDAAKMYAAEKLDAVIIASPHTLHYGHAVQALDAGCHVFLEKPMTTSSADAQALAEKAEASGKVVAIGYNTSSKQVFQWLRLQIRKGTFGPLEMVTGFISQGWMKATAGKWRQDPALSGGGQAYDSGAHILNSLLWSVESEPETVFAMLDNKGCAVDINSVMSVRFANGVLANVTISGNCAKSGRHMAFIFENGLVEIDGWGGDWIRVFADGFDEKPKMDIPETQPIENFVASVLGKAEPAAGTKNGVNHSLLMDGIYASAKAGVPVKTSELSGA